MKEFPFDFVTIKDKKTAENPYPGSVKFAPDTWEHFETLVEEAAKIGGSMELTLEVPDEF